MSKSKKNKISIIDYIKKIPKAELHIHIEGTLEPKMLFDLAKRNSIKIPFKNVNGIKRAYKFNNLDSFLKLFYQGSKVLIKEKDFFELTWAYALKCKKENIVHTEIFFDPQTHINRGISFNIVINGIYKALEKAKKDFGLTYYIIMCFLRHLDEKDAFKVLKKAIKHKDKIIGVGLDSSELGNPPKKFKKVFNEALKHKFLTVAHAGEEGPPQYIWDSLNYLKAKRIDHGVKCYLDKKLVEKLLINQVPLTVCPISNIKLLVFDKLKNHNLKELLNKKLMVTVNSDDPAYFGAYLNKNLIECQKSLNLSTNEIKQLVINSFKSSFLNDRIKNKWLKKVTKY